MKNCKKCGESKPLAEFYKHQQMADGFLNKCKVCTKSHVSQYRSENLEAVRANDRLRDNLPHRKALHVEAFAKYRACHPRRVAANALVRKEVSDGRLVPWPCMMCGEKAVAHHADYDRPLDVVWLCHAHHKQAHVLSDRLEAERIAV